MEKRDSSLQSFDYLLILRGACAFAVVLRNYPFEFYTALGTSHLEWLLRPFGYIPVLVFFCLSGFLITQNFILGRYEPGSVLGVWGYYRNRALRVLPLYYFSILACLLIYWPESFYRWDEVLALFGFVGAYKIDGGIIFNHVYWSLPVEVAFFVLAPVLFFFMRWLCLSLGALGALLFIILAYFIYSAIVFWDIPYDDGFLMSRVIWNRLAHHDVIYNFEVFLLGGIAAFYVNGQSRRGTVRGQLFFKVSLASLILLMFARTGIVGDALFQKGKVDAFTLYLLLPLLGLWFLGFTMLYAKPQLIRVSRIGLLFRRALEALGHWSYGVYLFHMPILSIVEKFDILSGSAYQNSVMSFLALICVIAFSAMTYRLIEKPVMRFRMRSGHLVSSSA
ncbi:acyltransferase [Pseudomonas sp. JH-2]|uniref:acyltransferase family protein n=1 Tax=Pseudomonas sp. JH-2 TaxID=3114998 RepID=UPI002E27574B|nr:acyltransferase [Pseudomonas sp. JH-2]